MMRSKVQADEYIVVDDLKRWLKREIKNRFALPPALASDVDRHIAYLSDDNIEVVLAKYQNRIASFTNYYLKACVAAFETTSKKSFATLIKHWHEDQIVWFAFNYDEMTVINKNNQKEALRRIKLALQSRLSFYRKDYHKLARDDIASVATFAALHKRAKVGTVAGFVGLLVTDLVECIAKPDN